MFISNEELIEINSHAKKCVLKSIDNILYLKDTIKIDLFGYLLNKYQELSDIYVGFKNTNGDEYVGDFCFYKYGNRSHEGLIIVNKTDISFLIDDLMFTNETLKDFILLMKNMKGGRDFQFNYTNAYFGSYKFRSHMDSQSITMRALPANANGFKKQHFPIKELLKIKNETSYYSTVNEMNISQIEEAKKLYKQEINELIKKCQIEKQITHDITTNINLETGEFYFSTNLSMLPSHRIEILNYIYKNFDKLNTPLYRSIIKITEEMMSKILEDDVVFINKDMVKSYIDLTDMANI